MDSTYFEGYEGIYLNDITFSNDIMLLVVLILLTIFAVIFRLNVPLFGKMISDINAAEQRQSIFETTEKDSFLFHVFMTFQTLLLCSIIIFLFTIEYKFFILPDITTTITVITILLLILLIFFLLKMSLFTFFGLLFTDKSAIKILFTNYQALLCIWGIFLYLPILWIFLVGEIFFIAVFLFIISYLVFRLIHIYRIFCIFFNKNTGLLFFSLYLCAQEIVPLVFLYEGLIYIYSIIEKNNIWQ